MKGKKLGYNYLTYNNFKTLNKKYMMEKKIKIKINGKGYDATIQTLKDCKDLRDTVIKCNVAGLGTIDMIQSNPTVNTKESIDDIDFILGINFEPSILKKLLEALLV